MALKLPAHTTIEQNCIQYILDLLLVFKENLTSKIVVWVIVDKRVVVAMIIWI